MGLDVLIADKMSSEVVTELERLGAAVRVAPELGADDLPGAIGDAEVLIVRSTKVTEATIRAGNALSLIVRAGAGVNTIDIEAAGKLGVTVANCPGKNTLAVAELALGLLIAADRRIPNATADLRNGTWRKKEYGRAAGLAGRTLAIIGLGSIGRALAARAAALEMHVIAWSRSLSPENAELLGLGYCATPEEAASRADAVSIHLAVTADTRGMIGESIFAAMKPGAIFVNTSRGEIVDTQALRRAIKEKQLFAALDVYEGEPSGGEAAFEATDLAAELVAATPHIGASTDQASEAIAAETVRVVGSYIRSGKPINAVNIRTTTEDRATLVVRHFNKVGVLANVLDVLRSAGINIEEMENTILQGSAAASCALHLDREPDEQALAQIRGAEHIIQVMVK